MNSYWTCPHCGANLDFGEKCDCEEIEDTNRRHHRHLKQFVNSLEDITDEFIRD